MHGAVTAPEASPSPAPPSPRLAAVADLYRHAAELAAAGDLEAARVVHEAIARMLEGAGPGCVVDLATRRKRG